MEFIIVYSSPAGSTKRAAEAMFDILRQQGVEVFPADLADPIATNTAKRRIVSSSAHCLCIGSPVYACHAVPPVNSFIAELSQPHNGYAVPLVTWGCVTSGLALYEMGVALHNKGYKIIGAVSLPAVHSMMWQAEHPLGEGRPSEQEISEVKKFTADIAASITQRHALDPEVLNYQPQSLKNTMQKLNIEVVRDVLPQKTVETSRCSRCNVCVAICPAAAITMDPYPVFGPACFLCYKCARFCPERAIKADLSKMEAGLRQRAATFQEKAEARFFS